MSKKIQTILFFIIFIIAGVLLTILIKYKISCEMFSCQKDTSEINLISADTEKTFIFTTALSKEGKITYLSNDTAKIEFNGETNSLKRVPSASGSKYENNDGSYVFWDKGDEAIIIEDGKTTQIIVDFNDISASSDNEITEENNANSTVSNNNINGEVLTFSIARQKVDCVGVGPMECLVVNDEYFYDGIAGFDFEPGNEYVITVQRTERENVPADAGIYEYSLIEVISKKTINLDDENKNDLALLQGNQWQWTGTQLSNDDIITPNGSAEFIAWFNTEGDFSSTTDCNTIGGTYTTNANVLTFGVLFSTKMACMEETLETAYAKNISETQSYFIDDQGQLILELKYDTGLMTFSPIEKTS